jgi:integrase/recombinase XerD
MATKHKTGYIPYINEVDFNNIYNEISPNRINIKLMFKLMYYLGLRVSEVCRIQYIDIVGDCEQLRVTLSKTNGTIKTRVIPEAVRPDLKHYLFAQKYFRTNDYIFEPDFRKSKNEFIQPSTLRWELSKIRKKLGLDQPYYIRTNGKPMYPIRIHALRNTFITNFYAKCKDIHLTQKVIGHKRLETTSNYIWVDTLKREKEVVNSI